MPKFGNKSKEVLSWANPELRKVMEEAIKYVDFSVLESIRTEEQHNLNVQNGKSKTTWDKSKHRPRLDNEGRFTSWAIDIAPYPIDWNNYERFIYVAGFIMCCAERLYTQGKITHKLRWGGDFNMNLNPKDDSFKDGGHFELLGD